MFSGLENPVHLLVILVVVLLVFGPKRLPDMGRSLGHGMRQFRESLSGKDEAEEAAPAPPAPAPDQGQPVLDRPTRPPDSPRS